MCPEQDDAEEGEVDGYAVDEGAEDAGGADIFGVVVRCRLGAGLDVLGGVFAAWLLAWVTGLAVAEGLGAEGGVLGCDDHGDGVVDCKDDEI